MKTLLNEEMLRMQSLAGITPDLHSFESFLLENKTSTIKELFSLLKEDIDNKTAKKAEDYVNNMSDEELKNSAKVAKELKRIPSVLSLTVDEFGDIMSLQHKKHNISAVQYHPESILTPLGENIVRNFIEANQK